MGIISALPALQSRLYERHTKCIIPTPFFFAHAEKRGCKILTTRKTGKLRPDGIRGEDVWKPSPGLLSN